MRNSNYNTNQKQLVLECLTKKTDKYVSANDILEYLLKHDQKIGLTTIYRILHTLENEGKLRVEILKNTRCFQLIDDDCKKHFHLKCEKCGKIEHFECKEMHDFCNHIGKEHGFIIDSQNAIGGICKNCMKKRGGK